MCVWGPFGATLGAFWVRSWVDLGVVLGSCWGPISGGLRVPVELAVHLLPKAGSTFKVAFARDAEEAIGLDIDIVDGVSAIIVGISGGAVHRWNEWRPELALRANDRIIEVAIPRACVRLGARLASPFHLRYLRRPHRNVVVIDIFAILATS